MALFKCKMCGGTLEVNPGESVAVCDSCGSKQTVPGAGDERIANLYGRANHLRLAGEFDKALSVYEQILNENNMEAEAHWGALLCRYGIEYVEDPATHKRIPTVNRAQYTSIFSDEDYKEAIANADGYQRYIYEAEAKAIDEIQKGILAISQKEEPFDVFISFKETDENGRRTPDAVLANDLYHQLTQEGFKVFFAPITLEDKLGTEYEPYIFAALNSAKVMIAMGTKPEYFNAVWVKNEWSRFLALIKNGAKKTLIPAYKDMDPYDLPEEFSHLMAQDMSKLGFMQDLIRGIKKIAKNDETKVTNNTVISQSGNNANINSLIERVFMFLEDGDWSSADEYCEKVLDIEPKNAQAYIGKLMADLKITKKELLGDCSNPFDDNANYQKAYRFADDALKSELTGYIERIKSRNEQDRLNSIYSKACHLSSRRNISEIERAISEFQSIIDWRDSAQKIEECKSKIVSIKEEDERQRIQKDYERKAFTKKATKITSIVAGCAAFVTLLFLLIIPAVKYFVGNSRISAGNYEGAVKILEGVKLGDSKEKYREAFVGLKQEYCNLADEYLAAGDNVQAAIWYRKAGNNDAANKAFNIESLVYTGEYVSAGIMSDGTLKYQTNNEYDHYYGSDRDSLDGCVAFLPGVGSTIIAVDGDGHLLTHDIGMGSLYHREEMQINKYNGVKCALSGKIDGKQHNTYYIILLLSDGTVVETNDSNRKLFPSLDEWKNIKSIQEINDSIYGIDNDGRVYCLPSTKYSHYNTSDLENVKKIVEIGSNFIVLHNDGKISAAGENSYIYNNVYGKEHVQDVIVCDEALIFLYEDGKVELLHQRDDFGSESSNAKISELWDEVAVQLNKWSRITTIYSGASGIIGITDEGQVKYVSRDIYWQKNNYSGSDSEWLFENHSTLASELDSWNDIVCVFPSPENLYSRYARDDSDDWAYVIGIKSDGTAVSTGKGEYYTSREVVSETWDGKKDYKWVDDYHDDGTYNDVTTWKLW